MDKQKHKDGVASKIRDARKAAGLTQIELAEKLGVGQNQVSDWERAARMPEVASLLRLADALAIPVGKLIS
jgi:transcriptional regulator with XRE-family HTH domain